MSPLPLVWLDLETTGLHPDSSILQIGLRYTTPELKTVIETEILVAPPSWAQWEKGAVAMHETSGLKQRAHTQGLVFHMARIEVLRFLEQVAAVAGTRSFLMAGNSIHFDRMILAAQGLSDVLEFFHYRHLDVSFFKSMYMSQDWGLLPEAKAHNALADIDNSIATLRRYMTELCYANQYDHSQSPTGWFG